MKTFVFPFFGRVLIVVIVLIALLLGCRNLLSPDDDSDSTHDEGQTTERESSEEEYAQVVADITATGTRTVDETLEAHDEVDSEHVADAILEIESVEQVRVSDSGAAVTFELEDGSVGSYPTARFTDERLFSAEDESNGDSSGLSTSTVSNSIADLQYSRASSSGHAKVLILSSVQNEFAFPLGSYADQLNQFYGVDREESVVDIFVNEEANLKRFQGDYLAHYEVVLIFTHRWTAFADSEGWVPTAAAAQEVVALQTGELYKSESGYHSPADYGSLLYHRPVEYSYLEADGTHVVTPRWFKDTTTNGLENTFIFLVACESIEPNTHGWGSMAETLIELGAAAVSGFDRPFNNEIATWVVDAYQSSGTRVRARTWATT